MQPGDFLESIADIDKSTIMLNYMPTTDIAQGIPQFIDRQKDKNKLHEMWTYTNGSSVSHLYFENNILFRIEE